MKDTVVKFLRENGFYLSFGVGVIALVAALAVYNVNSSRQSQQNQEINLNEPMEQDFAVADETTHEAEVQETLQDGDMDVPMDMWKTQEAEASEAQAAAVTEEAAENTEAVQDVMSGQTAGYVPLDGLEFHGLEELSMPVLGNTILPYSMDTTVYFKTLGTYRCNPGMLLQAPVGTDVASVWHGQVTKVEDTKEYGTVVTVNLGSGYMVQYGQLQNVRVTAGDEVFQDTVLGTVAEPTAYYQLEGSHLYFAMTKDEEPINPMEVLQIE